MYKKLIFAGLLMISGSSFAQESPEPETAAEDPYCAGWTADISQATKGDFSTCLSYVYGSESTDTIHEFIAFESGHYMLTGEFYLQPEDMFFLLIAPDGKPKTFKVHALPNGGGDFSVRSDGWDEAILAGTYKMTEGLYGDDDKPYIARLGPKGELTKPVILKTEKRFWPYHVFPGQDGKSIIIGTQPGEELLGTFASVVVDNNGENPKMTVYDKKKLSGPREAVQGPNGDIYTLGWDRKLGGNQKVWLSIMSPEGKIKKTVKLSELDFMTSFNLALAPDGHIWVTGAKDFGDDWETHQDLMLMKLSPKGKIIWKKIVKGPANEQGTVITTLPSGELIVGSKIDSDDPTSIALTKFSKEGKQLWHLENKLPDDTTIDDILITDQGQLLLAINTSYSEDYSMDILLMRLE